MANPRLVCVSTVTPPASYDLTSLTTVKSELGVSGSQSDAQLKRYISAASIAAEQFCNRDFVVEAVQDAFWPQRDAYPVSIPGGVSPLQLSRWPLVSLGAVVENAVTLTIGTDFIADMAKGQLSRLDLSAFPKPWAALPITVSYSAGYATIPPDIEDAVIRMIRNRWFARNRDPMAREINIPGVLEQQFWVATGTDAGNMTPDVVDILENYRVPVIG